MTAPSACVAPAKRGEVGHLGGCAACRLAARERAELERWARPVSPETQARHLARLAEAAREKVVAVRNGDIE